MPTSNAHSPSASLSASSRALRALLLGGALSVLFACGKTELKEAPLRAVKVLTIAADVGEAGLDAWLPGRQHTSLADGVAATVAYYRAS